MSDIILPDDPGELVVARVQENGSYEPFEYIEGVRVPDGAELIEVRTTTIGGAVKRAQNILKSRDGVVYIATLAERGSEDDEAGHKEYILRTYLARA